jgi:hypothetical protein
VSAPVSQDGLSSPTEPSSTVSALTGFDPSRIAEVVQQIEPTLLAPIIKKAADEFYCTVLETAQDYLQDNLDWNLKSHVAMLERENQRMRTELWDVDRKLGGNMLGEENRLKSISDLQDASNGYYQLIWEVARKHEGETSHETALRYIRERAAATSEAGDAQ